MSFSIGGVRITLGFYFFMTLALFLLLDTRGAAPLFLTAVLIHELGHLLIIRLLHLPIAQLRLCCPSLGLCLAPEARLSDAAGLALHLAGCAANLAAAGILVLVGGGWALRFSAVNMALGLAQLLPVVGLDGGSAVSCLCSMALGPARGMRAAGVFCRGAALAGVAACVFFSVRYGVQFSLLAAGLLFGWSFFCAAE